MNTNDPGGNGNNSKCMAFWFCELFWWC